MSPPLVQFALVELFREDWVLSDKEMHKFSVNKKMQNTELNPTGFMLFSDRVAMMYPGYLVDMRLAIRAGPDTPTLNFNYMKELYLSKDLSRNNEFNWMELENNRFLDGKVDMSEYSVTFSSYPRSGNTFLRRYIESITGVTSGSNF
jgi:hypothetical protein